MLLFSPKKEDRLRVSKRFFLDRNKEEMTREGVKKKASEITEEIVRKRYV